MGFLQAICSVHGLAFYWVPLFPCDYIYVDVVEATPKCSCPALCCTVVLGSHSNGKVPLAATLGHLFAGGLSAR